MRVHHPETTIQDGEVRVSARVELDTPNIPIADELWFTLPQEFAPLLTDRIDPFAVAMLHPAMTTQETLHVDGAMSPRLTYGLRKAQGAYHMWLPKAFTPIDIVPTSYQPFDLADTVERSAGMLFSGGVDSLYTLWTHRPEQEQLPDYRVKYLIFVHSLDILLKNPAYFDKRVADYQAFADRLGLTLIPMRTNFRGVSLWNLHRSRMLANGTVYHAIGLLLSRGLANFFIASSTHYNILPRSAAHPAIDPLLSTETLTMFNDGNEATRAQRMIALADWQPSYDIMRVCRETTYKNHDYLNCCNCDKCLRAMMVLGALGKLDDYTAFHEPLTPEKIRGYEATIGNVFQIDELNDIIALMQANGRQDMLRDLQIALWRSRAVWLMKNVKSEGNRLKKRLRG